MPKGQKTKKQDQSGSREKKGRQAIDRALKILNCFNFSRPVWDPTELSGELGLTLPTTKRILKALEEKGILNQNARTGFYEVGLRVFELGALAIAFPTLRFDEVRALEWGQLVRQTRHTLSHRISTLEEDLAPFRRLSHTEGIPHTNRKEKA